MTGEKIDPNAMPPSAGQLRQTLVDEQMAEMKKLQAQKSAEQQKLTAFTDDFLKGHVTDDEIARVRRLVMNAVKDGKLEALVYTFRPNSARTAAAPSIPATVTGRQPCSARQDSFMSGFRNSESRKALR